MGTPITQIKPPPGRQWARFLPTAALLCAGLTTTVSHARAQCPRPATGRVLLLSGGFAVTQTVLVVTRRNDWWTTPRRSFHITHGGSPSAGQDLLLHGAIAYHVSRGSSEAWAWACTGGAAPWLGAATGILFGLPKEIGDGFREGKGFAADDVAAAVIGAVLPALHETIPVTRLASLKGFWWPSQELRNRPPGALPQLENDYAGQRYFLSVVPGRVWTEAPIRWLGVALGHSTATWASAPPVSQWFLTLDVDLRRLPWSGRVWDVVAAIGDHLKFPLPGVRLSGGTATAGWY